MAEIVIREAQVMDAPVLLAIYRPYVEKTTITFEYQVPTEDVFAKRIQETLTRYPYLVAEAAGEVLGYAYASVYKPREAYDWSCEVTVYVKQKGKARGVGSALYRRLEALLAKQGICTLAACITAGNDASVAFHQKWGYHQVASFEHLGYKFGAWQDVLWFQKQLGTLPENPSAFVPYPVLKATEKVW